jgi:hypothetical protein
MFGAIGSNIVAYPLTWDNRPQAVGTGAFWATITL